MPQPLYSPGSQLSLLLAGSCMLGGWAERHSAASDVWSGVSCAAAVLGAEQRQGPLDSGDAAVPRWEQLLGAVLAAVAVNAVVLIRQLARMDILTVRGQSKVGALVKSALASTNMTMPLIIRVLSLFHVGTNLFFIDCGKKTKEGASNDLLRNPRHDRLEVFLARLEMH